MNGTCLCHLMESIDLLMKSDTILFAVDRSRQELAYRTALYEQL